MNGEMIGIYDFFVSLFCCGLLTGIFLLVLKRHFRITRAKEILFALFLFGGLSVLGVFEEFGSLPFILFMILQNGLVTGTIVAAFEGEREKKLLAAALLLALVKPAVNFFASIMVFLSLAFRHGILKRPVGVLLPWQGYLIDLLAYIITAVFLCFLAERSNKLLEGKTKKWCLMTTGPLFFIISVMDSYNWCVSRGVLFWGGENRNLYENQLFSHGAVCVLSLLCMFGAGAYFYGMHKIHREWQKKEQYRLQTVYLKGLKEQNERMDKIRHDMKNHIISLQGLLASGSLKKLEEYLNMIAGNGGIRESMEITGCRALDALLCEKQRVAQEKKILWKCDMQPFKKLLVDEFDLCVLIGNGLDNAIKACEKIEDEKERFIHIQAGWVKNCFLLEIKNSVCEKEAADLGTSFLVRNRLCKSRGKVHQGIGFLNMEEAAEKYNGIVSVVVEHKIFSLSVMIPAGASLSDDNAGKGG